MTDPAPTASSHPLADRVLRGLPELEPELVGWRRHLHENPELSWQEHETAAFVEGLLRRWGYEPERPTPTSVVARLRGGRPGRTVALRSDLDALPITEENAFEFASKRPGVMHACGHDGHAAMLLAAARLLAPHRDELAGELRFVFQHAEESPPGGAAELVEKGVVDGCDAVLGAHLMSMLDAGKVVAQAGPLLAAADMFELTVQGKGGHGAMPHTAIDPIPVASQLVMALQLLVSRQTDPLESVVVSVTRIQGGTANNVIPESVELGGTVRTFRPELRAHARASMQRICEQTCAAFGATCDFRWIDAYAAVLNDPAIASVAAREAAAVVGEGNVVEIPPIMGGEDFSSYLTRAPGAFLLIGARSEAAGSTFPHHHPRFTVDESALPTGVAVMVRTALALADPAAGAATHPAEEARA